MERKSVSGVYIGPDWHSGNFRYKYICQRCSKPYCESCPDVSWPSLCHMCYIGGGWRRKLKGYEYAARKRNRKKWQNQRSG